MNTLTKTLKQLFIMFIFIALSSIAFYISAKPFFTQSSTAMQKTSNHDNHTSYQSVYSETNIDAKNMLLSEIASPQSLSKKPLNFILASIFGLMAASFIAQFTAIVKNAIEKWE